MQTYGKTDVTYAWYAGNSGVTNRSGRFIASHIGHTGLICFGAGANTLFELARYDSALPIGDQGFVVLPHLAGLGIGGIENGVITDSYGMLVVAVFHLIFSAVYAGGAMLHSFRYKEDLGEYPQGSRPNKFDFKWDDPDRLTFILGHHLLFLGLGCVQFVEWAKYHGIYDPAMGVVRKVEYNLYLSMVWNHQIDFLTINSLEDVMGGHAFLAFFLSAGAVWHIFSKPFGEYTEFKGKGLLSAEFVLSTSLAGAAFIAFVAAFWASMNTTIYPTDLYGGPLNIELNFAPYFSDTDPLFGGDVHSARSWLSNFHFYLGFFYLQGHFWHGLRAMGFDFKRVEKLFDQLESNEISLNPGKSTTVPSTSTDNAT